MSLVVNAYCTSLSPPPLNFPHQLNAQRDRTDPALASHLQGMIGFVMQGGREMSQSLYAVLRHVERVQHHFSFDIEIKHLTEMGQWAWQANAILYVPTGAITDPAGRTLVDPSDGSKADSATMPYPVDAVARKKQHDVWLHERNIRVAPGLPPVHGETETLLRDPRAVAERMMALTLIAIRAESQNGGNPITTREMHDRFPTVFDALTPNERVFMVNKTPTPQEVVDHTWKYEAADTLRWALGRASDLVFPSQICDVPATAADLVQNGPEAILASATLRPTSVILDHVDLHLRLHWAVRQAEVDQTEPPTGLQASILQERRHALNWLMQFQNADWDDVTTPT